MQLLWLLPYLLVLTLVHLLRVIRWKPLLDPIVDLDLKTHNRIGAVGFMAMFLLPLRLGELVRPYLVKIASGGTARMTRVLSTVVVERVADGLMVSLVLCCVLLSLPAGDPITRERLTIGAFGALAVFTLASILLAAAHWQHDRTVRLLQSTVGKITPVLTTKVIDLLDAFLDGLRSLPSKGAFMLFIVLTAVYWGVNGVGVWLMLQAFSMPVDLVGAYAMMACVVVGMMIPNAPGNVGSFWYFLLMPLPMYSIPHNGGTAIAFGLTVWLLQLIQQSVFGLWYIARGDVSWSQVLEATYETETSLTTSHISRG